MLVAQAHSFAQQARLAITLAWIAGYTNVLTILTCGTATSHVTGSASNLGRDVAEGSWGLAGFMLFLLGSFVVGAGLSALMTETGRRRGWESIYVLPVAVEAGLLMAMALGVEMLEPGARATGWALWWMSGTASLAMGVQNATITRISSGVVRTTHLTGVLTDLGSEAVGLAYWLRDRGSSRSVAGSLASSVREDPTARRLALLASVAGSFALGAGLGTLVFEWGPRWSMLPPVAFLLWIIWQDIRTPICEIEASALVGAGLSLPEGLAVHHLRRDRGRRGRVHRLPDLVRWYERLSGAVRVVILDLGDVGELDENAALELRALVERTAADGRALLISGISGAQYRAMRAGGAGEVLEPGHVCPDLELAVARGLAMLEEEGR